MIVLRPATEADIPYVLNSFVGAYSSAPAAQDLSFKRIRQLLVDRLESPAWNCSILYESDAPDLILGYIVWKSPSIVAWVQVRGHFKRRGFARQLLTAIGANPGRPIKTPFLPGAADCRRWRSLGYPLHHRPWLV